MEVEYGLTLIHYMKAKDYIELAAVLLTVYEDILYDWYGLYAV